MPPDATAATDPLVGTMAGSYQLESLIGRGGMGAVYAARHPVLGREVAVKVLTNVEGDPARLERYQREALAASRIGHPAVVPVTDFGLLPDGRPYGVMERLQGVSLRDRMDRWGALPLAEVAPWLDTVMEALAAAHAVGIVHRDLKPDNLFLEQGPDGQFRVRLLDFGIAKLLTGDAQLGPQITRAGQVLGSPDYMAPEQTTTSYGGVGPWTDVYSLGALAFHVLTGRPPYVAAKVGDLLLAHLQAPIPSLREHRAGMPAGLDAVLRQALAKRPEGRFSTMDAFRRAFRGSLRASVALPPVPAFDEALGPVPPAPSPGLGTDDTVPPFGISATAQTLPPAGDGSGDDTLPPFGISATAQTLPPAGDGSTADTISPFGAMATASTLPPAGDGSGDDTLPPYGAAATATTIRPDAYVKATDLPVAATPGPALVSPWTKDQDSLTERPPALDALAHATPTNNAPKGPEPGLGASAAAEPAPPKGRRALVVLVLVLLAAAVGVAFVLLRQG